MYLFTIRKVLKSTKQCVEAEMKTYIKTALITSLIMLILTAGAGVLLGKLYQDSKETEKVKTEEEIDMNLFGSSKVEIEGEMVHELRVKGKNKNVQTFSFENEKEIYDVKKSAQIREELERMKKKNTYSIDRPLWAYNPFGTNELSLYLYFKTAVGYSVKYTVHVEEKEIPDFTRNLYSNKGECIEEHEYLITGLVPGVKNYILISLYDAKGNMEKQVIYSIKPSISEDSIQTRLSGIEGKSAKKLANGLYFFLGKDIYVYDNSGVLRGVLPRVNSSTANLLLVENQMVYNYTDNAFAFVDNLGQVHKTYTLDGYKIAGDFTYDGYGNLFVLASSNKAETTKDRIVTVNLKDGEQKERVDFAKIFPDMKKKASKGNEDKLNWLNLNSIAMVGSDSVVVSSKELSSIIKLSSLNSVRPSVDYILSQDTVWKDSGYEDLLYAKTTLEEGDKLFKSQFGQSSLAIVKDIAPEQYYITMFNHNYGNSSTRKDINWSEVEGVGTAEEEGSASKYYKYYVDEEEAAYMLSDSFNVLYSREGSAFAYEDHLVVNVSDAKKMLEYDSDGRVIRGLSYKETVKPAKIQKQNMKKFWYR